jgi:Acetyltransferases
VCVHSLAVLPEHQGKKVGSTLMKSYIQRIKEAEIADRIALLAHDDMIGFYESLGFENKGPSKCQFGGGGWTDMVCILCTRQTCRHVSFELTHLQILEFPKIL